MTEEPTARPVPTGAAAEGRGLARLCAVAALLAVAFAPFLALQPNRIVSGEGFSLPALPAAWLGLPLAAVLTACALVAALAHHAAVQALAGAAGALAALLGAGLAATALLPAGATLARVSLGSGFWLTTGAFGLILADALVKLRGGPLARITLAFAAVGAVLAVLAAGLWNDLSIMREYAANRDSFWQQGARHLVLVGGSLAPALLLGIPLGYLCHRLAAARGAVLAVLSVIQTVPSIAMFGLMMAPLAALAAAYPALGAAGIRGIGLTPALLALFLYSLLPVVANTVAGFAAVPPAVVEAARGMGMGPLRRLAGVEWPLAFPVIVTGVRIVLVQNIGLAAVAALIGAGGFGTFVFRGMGQTAMDLVLLGAVPIVILAFLAAVVLDAVAGRARGRAA
ncbi:ABC-type proline/glycine betaine transport system, permease component [Chelatococcus sambhunathii]|uniref:ABC transporter permease n=2 Tax=Chelatococcus TaxID=28209 RepID=A0AAC9JP79_9HYPH|nr:MULTISPECIES: ABC transporter permease [Chelatococcus]APF37168.1 ABC transporter permease [Chelatococcus daeguensis]CUA89339.1 ABC-type proline/glycine betaine transport system, permease component [Chelatococcus sambhunathii]